MPYQYIYSGYRYSYMPMKFYIPYYLYIFAAIHMHVISICNHVYTTCAKGYSLLM